MHTVRCLLVLWINVCQGVKNLTAYGKKICGSIQSKFTIPTMHSFDATVKESNHNADSQHKRFVSPPHLQFHWLNL